MQKDVRQFIKSLKSQGWKVERAGAHSLAYPPQGAGRVTISNTPSDCRSIKNAQAEARRLGWDDPKRPRRRK